MPEAQPTALSALSWIIISLALEGAIAEKMEEASLLLWDFNELTPFVLNFWRLVTGDLCIGRQIGLRI